MNKQCFFCSKPILSDYTILVFCSVKRNEQVTAKQVSKELKMTVQQANNYLVLLCQLNLINRRREGTSFLYFT